MSTELSEVLKSFENLCMPDPIAILATLGSVAGSKLGGMPIHLFLIGASASGKNEIVESLFNMPKTVHISTFTESALLSASGPRDRSPNATGGILMEIGMGGSGIFIISEFNTILKQRPDSRGEALAALHGVCSGIWDRPRGAGGGIKLSWRGRVQVIAACTENLEEHQQVMGRIGERFLYCQMPVIDRKGHIEAAKLNARNGRGQYYKEWRDRIVPEFLLGLTYPACPESLLTKDDEDTIGYIANFVTLARSPVTRDYQKAIEYVHASEGPARVYQTLQRLMCGLLLIGVSPEYSRRIVARVGLGSLPALRRAAIISIAKAAEQGNGVTTVAEIMQYKSLHYYTRAAIKRTLEDLESHGIIERDGNHEDYWQFTSDAAYDFFSGFNLSDVEFREKLDNDFSQNYKVQE